MESYDEATIKVLEGTEGVRLRPSMYIGDTSSRGLHHLVYEVIDNSIDEAMAGRCSKVDIVIHEDNSISIRDDGAGIPAGDHPDYGVSTLEVILTKLHSGGKFEKKAYQVSGGLHGVGLAAVCALSEKFHVESYRNGKIYAQDYEKGVKVTDVEVKPQGDEPDGTLIHFRPDSSIFNVTQFDFDTLAGRFRELAYLTSKFRINFSDSRNLDEEGNFRSVSYYYEGGLRQFVEDSIGEKKLLLEEDQPTFYMNNETDGVVVELAFTYTQSYSEIMRGFVNNISTTEGGTHITGLKTVLTRTINDFAKEFGILAKDEKTLSGNDIREGIIAIISVKVPEPQFEGQTKTKLGNSAVDGIVQTTVGEPLKHFLEANQRYGKTILEKAISARKAREAAKKARDAARQEGNKRVTLPGKLVSCREKDPKKRELFIVEGQSAGGTAVSGRDSQFQEILFLRGKVLNVEKARLNRAEKNAEIMDIKRAVGTGFQDEFDMSRLRYGKIILLMDADVDGSHIATLLLTFFYRYMKPLVEEGILYIAKPPLYKAELKKEAKKQLGKKVAYLTDDQDRKRFEDALRGMDIEVNDKNIEYGRFKGLGEMNDDELEKTTMNVSTRTIEQVTIQDAIEAEDWLVRLMGDDVSPRKKFIQTFQFEDQTIEETGEFYKVAFSDDDDSEDIAEIIDREEERIVKKEIEREFDEYDPDRDQEPSNYDLEDETTDDDENDLEDEEELANALEGYDFF